MPDAPEVLRRMFDEIINQGRLAGTHTGEGLGFPATGKACETVSANIGRFRGELAAEHWSEQGMLPMLMQLGLLPAPGPGPGRGDLTPPLRPHPRINRPRRR